MIADADPGEFTTNSLIVTRVIGANNTNLNGCECAPEPASVTAVGVCGEPRAVGLPSTLLLLFCAQTTAAGHCMLPSMGHRAGWATT